ncbi:MAG: T9SS type A sorting domain-containing protein [Ignavibacteria bacterium]|nr:T9SS type A sorting domain-containing protein [Ignavibacteria bacterium]
MAGIKERYGKENVQTYFEDLIKDPNEGNKSRIKKHLAGFYLSKDEDNRAVALFDELKDDKNSKKDNFEGLYEKFNLMLHKKKDIVSAKNLLAEMKNKFVDDEEANIHIATAEMLISNINNNNHALGKKQNETAVSNDNEVIKEYALFNNYPNPFNPVTTITYQLPKDGVVTLKIFDMLGKEVMTLVNEQKEMGRYTVQFDASSLASGMYVYQLRANDYTSTKKMLLLK